MIKNVSFLIIPIYTLIIPVAPVFIPLLYGSQWNTAIILVQLLSILGIYRGILNPVGSLLYAKGYVKRSFYWNLMMVIVVGIGVDLGAIYYGIAGVAAFKSLLAIVLVFFSYLLLIKKCLGPCFLGYVRTFIPFLIFGIIGAVVAFFIRSPFFIVQLLMQVAVGGGIYLLLMVLFYRHFLGQFFGRYIRRQKIVT